MFVKEVVAASFSKAAPSYESVSEIQLLAVQELLERIKLLSNTPRVILDLGSGTGIFTRALKQLYPSAKVYGLDIASGMAQFAKQREPWFNRSQYLIADATAIPLADNSVDLLVSSLMLHWCNDIDAVLHEMKRVMTPNAPLFFSTLGPDTLKEFKAAWESIDETPHVHPFVDMHHLGDGLLKAGFIDPVLDRHDHVLTFREPKQAFDSLRLIGAHNQLTQRRRTLTGKSRFNKFYQRYLNMQSGDYFPLTYELVFAHAWSPQEMKGHGFSNEVRISIDNILGRK